MSKHTYADSTLKSWTKDELIRQIRILENNCAVRQERLNNQAKLLKIWAPVAHAHWIENSSEYYKFCYGRGQTPEQTEYLTESDVACSACLRKFNITDNSFTHECANYCPNCGAKMDGEDRNV